MQFLILLVFCWTMPIIQIVMFRLLINWIIKRKKQKPMKPKITKQDLAQLNKMNKGAFYIQEKSLFERFYDTVGNILSGGKSFAPAELKGFR